MWCVKLKVLYHTIIHKCIMPFVYQAEEKYYIKKYKIFPTSSCNKTHFLNNPFIPFCIWCIKKIDQIFFDTE